MRRAAPLALLALATLACGGMGSEPVAIDPALTEPEPTPELHPDHPDAQVPHVHGSDQGTLEVTVGRGGRDVDARTVHWATHRHVPALHACLEATWASEPEARGGGSLSLPLDREGRVTGLEGSAAKPPHADCFGEVLEGSRFPRRPNQVDGKVHLTLDWHPTPGEPLAELDVPMPRTKARPLGLEAWWDSLDRVLQPVDPDASREAASKPPAAPTPARSRGPTLPSDPPLQLSATRGDAPLEVRFTGPDALVALGKGPYHGWLGCSYTVDWGDGTTGPDRSGGGEACADAQRHRYTTPGTYTVVATRFDVGPTDRRETTWRSEVEVVVTGEAAGTDTVTLGEGPAPLPYSSPVPVRVKADPKGASQLTVQVSAEGAPVLFTVLQVNGPVDRTLSLPTDRSLPLDQALARGVRTFDVEVALERGGRRVGKAARQTVEMTGRPPPNGVTVQAYQARAGEVWLEASKGALTKYRWWVDWGDGTTEAGGVKARGGRDELPMAPLRHRYEAPGTYGVAFRYEIYPGAELPVSVEVTAP